ncbi:hypothetical protein ACIBSV_37295 [Embleya sp. NPDC050154]|uniref:hypothetical protein n=1 Tax=Embleya sp. NPDC050154 TaxID=3363988 RepID=UPI0037AB67B2
MKLRSQHTTWQVFCKLAPTPGGRAEFALTGQAGGSREQLVQARSQGCTWPGWTQAAAPELTIDSSEWDGANGSWRPAETASDMAKLGGDSYRSLHNPTMMTIGRGYTLQVYSCVGTPSHLPRTIMQ